MIRRFSLLVLPAIVIAAAGSAQDSEILHEYFEYTPPARSVDNTVPLLPEPGAAAPGGLGAQTDGPEGITLTPGGPVPSHGFFEDGMGGLRNRPATAEGDATLDRETEPEGMLRYQVVFEPSVSTWKRSAVRNALAFDGTEIALRVSDAGYRPVSVAGAAPFGFDSFTGRARVLAAAGERIPIPSVAPDMRVHALRVSPSADASITKDSADNYYLTLTESGRFDVEFDVSAARSYFGGPLPVTDARPGSPWLPEALIPRARAVLAAASVNRGMTEVEIATRLSSYFGGFEARELAPSETSADTYSDISLSRVGVCRHRAMAFVITAAATGLRARYVNNEAHAFVEVYFSGYGYRRIDLGGASAGLETIGGSGAVHEREANPLDAGGGGGAPYETTHRESLDESLETAPSDHEPDNAAHVEGAHEAEPRAAEQPPRSAHSELEPTLLTAEVATERAYRGDTIVVRATLQTLENSPIEGAQIEVVISDLASGYFGVLGTLVTGPDGHASQALELPDNVPAGRMNVQLRFAGDDRHAPSDVQ